MDIDRIAEARLLGWVLGAGYLFDALGTALPLLEWYPLVTPLPLIAAALLALRNPVAGAVLAAVTWPLVAGIGLRMTGNEEYNAFGELGVPVSHALAALAVVVLLAARCGRTTATWGSTAVAAGAVAGVCLREPVGFRAEVAGSAVVLVALATAFAFAAGIAVRQGWLRPGEWPVPLVLGVLVLFDVGAVLRLDVARVPTGVAVALVGAAVVGTAAAAVLAPRAPVRWASVGMGIAAVCGVVLRELAHPIPDFDVPVSTAAAQSVLVVHLVRVAPRRTAALGVTGLAGADLLVLSGLSDRVEVGPELRAFLVASVLLLLAAVGTGLYLRFRDGERVRAVRVAAGEARAAERLALARELHDVVAHHVTGIVVAAQGAKVSPGAAAVALDRIEVSRAAALAAMRRLVHGLRDGGPETSTGDLAADLRALAADTTGLTVRLELELPEALPPGLGGSVLRLVQESLTNAAKHAEGADLVTVHIGAVDGDLRVLVSDNGSAGTERGGGYGLVGMRERVDLLGGRFTAGPTTTGWTVDARLPLREGAA
ncbi:histidine kinase [Actinokineospora sp. PR83]|uniref:sensor histidine kinase n=1 Tax=Actinokineospora sp. PR83 TaxID=2884908 RepID=UPI0027E13671|nr:sensor histidine kinase [Actinokineospora sp. PR83]MCG8917647.1 histidine kinase [Actinokineospora sp. PR83]